MQTSIAPVFRGTADGVEAERILRACVHCGFCNATCPTYQLDANELDGPRGRIYLIKQMLEGNGASDKTLTHLDRCLTCRACESTCPSGVEYGRLADIGRRLAEDSAGRAWPERLFRRGIRWVLPYRRRVAALIALARGVRPLLPARLREMIPSPPAAAPAPAAGPAAGPAERRMILLEGCVQPSLAPGINAAARRVLARAGIGTTSASAAGCCGAISHHMSAHEEGLAFMRRNIDAWWPLIEGGENGAEAIVITASGCATVVKDYGHLLREDPDYAPRAARISELARDLSEVVAPELPGLIERMPATASGAAARPAVAYHPPCTLQHGQKLPGAVEGQLAALGFELRPFAEAHLCCGSAGTYSLLEPDRAERLLARKLSAIEAVDPAEILTANIGCIMHLARRAAVPVRHWIEAVDERLAPPPPG